MADRNIAEGLQPSLLDRLTDMHPENDGKREDRVIDVDGYATSSSAICRGC